MALPVLGAGISEFAGLLAGSGPFSPVFALIPGRTVFMRRTDSTSLRSLTVSPPFRAIHTNTKPRSRWRLPWSLDSTMYCRSLRTLNAQRCTVGPQLRLLYFA